MRAFARLHAAIKAPDSNEDSLYKAGISKAQIDWAMDVIEGAVAK